MAIALLRSFNMRTHVIWVLGCSIALTACLLSDFREAERRERERMRASSQRTVETSQPMDAGLPERDSAAADGGDSGASSTAGSAGTIVVAGAGGRAGQQGGAGADAEAGSAGGSGRGTAGRGAAGRAGSSEAGVGGAGEAAPVDAGTSDAAASCGDTTSDVEHCGRCENSCQAERALASCVDSRCMRACAPGFGDCNMDLMFGDQGDGCEIDLSIDSAHCGACGRGCEPPWGTIGFCEERQCQLQTVQVEGGTPVGVLHGHPEGGDAYEQLCGRDEVQVGIDVATDGDFVLGFAVRCAPLWLGGTRAEMSLATGPSRALPLLGNRGGVPVTPVTLECPPGSVMNGVGGATGYFNADNTLFIIKAISLLCARPRASDSWVELEPGSTQSAGSFMGNVVEMFSDNCPPGEAVVGLIGRAGHFIDALSAVCAPISITQRAQ